MAQVEVKHFTERGHDQSVTVGSPKAEEALIAIFGASGDLTARKLIPALYRLWTEGFLTDRAPIVGVARRKRATTRFARKWATPSVKTSRPAPGRTRNGRNSRSGCSITRPTSKTRKRFVGLRKSLEDYERQSGVRGKQIVYLATTPELFTPAVESMAKADMIPPANSGRTLRVVFEKPYGHDLKSAQQLTPRLGRHLCEEQIYRIDHYLGKETVQNILAVPLRQRDLRARLFNRNHVDHVQITVAESQGHGARPRRILRQGRRERGTCCRTTCCSSCVSWRWSRPRFSGPTRFAAKSSRCCRRSLRAAAARSPNGRFPGSTRKGKSTASRFPDTGRRSAFPKIRGARRSPRWK